MSKAEFTQILAAYRAGQASTLTRELGGASYVRRFEPPERLILLGGGHVALALASIASMLGFSVVVVDDRPEFANYDRFPMAQRVICDGFADAIDTLSLRQTDYICMLTRGQHWDEICLQAIRKRGVLPRYLGMLASRRRAESVRRKLAEAGYPADLLASLRSPVGLPIGALTAEEIAVSICAELIEERRKAGKTEPDNCLLQTGVDEDALAVLADAETLCALLLVLSTEGQTPLKSGALMAVDCQGRGYGTVGGGVAEAKAMRLATELIGSGEARVLTVPLYPDGTDQTGESTGTMRIFIEDQG